MFTCPHTGVGLAVVEKLRQKNIIDRDDRVIVISTAHGLKFTASKVAYHDGQLKDVVSR